MKENFATSDASEISLRAILKQKRDSRYNLVANTFRTLGKAEQIYAAHQKEVVAVVDTILHWRAYRQNITFTVYTFRHHS